MKKTTYIQLLTIIGILLTVNLAVIYYTANYDMYALPSFCSQSELIDCDGAAKSEYAQFLGIPLCYWGMFFYLIVMFLTFTDKLKNIKFLGFLNVFKNPKAYIVSLGTIAFAVSMVMAGISFFVLKKICVLCLATYLLDFIIVVLALECNFKNFADSCVKTFKDFIAGVKQYPKTFVVLLILFVSFITYSGVTFNFVPHLKRRHDIMHYRKIKHNPYRVEGNILGHKNAPIVVEVFSDFVCPMCYIHNIMLHKATKEFDNIVIMHYNYPFDKECNTNMSMTMHPHACMMSRAALASKKQNNYWGMSSLLYENQPKNPEEVFKLAEKNKLDIAQFKKDFYSKQVKDELQSDLNVARKREINATPTMFIDGERYVGIKPYYELKEIFKKHGAK